MITKIVLTGGPCAGKTTALKTLKEVFTKKGYKVLMISEAATDLISGGLSQSACTSSKEFQQYVIRLQLQKEKIFEEMAEASDYENILIICDRGLLDGKAYVTLDEFKGLLEDNDLTYTGIWNRYDAVFHLLTAAKDKGYNKDNNEARQEDEEEAIDACDRVLEAWTGHPHLKIINNEEDFQSKIDTLVREVDSMINPVWLERKFLIEYPDINWLENFPFCRKIELVQTYINSDAEEEISIRARKFGDDTGYYLSVKNNISGIERVETEDVLSKEEYENRVYKEECEKDTLTKIRYCIVYKHQYMKIDVYPFWNDKAILEVELSDKDTDIILPDNINVIKEVTGNDDFKNKNIARQYGVSQRFNNKE